MILGAYFYVHIKPQYFRHNGSILNSNNKMLTISIFKSLEFIFEKNRKS